MIALLLPALALSTAAAFAPRTEIDVLVLSRHHPAALELRGPRTLSARAADGVLLVDGHPTAQPLELPSGRWELTGAGGLRRDYQASLRLRAVGGELHVVTRMGLQTYVALAVASETDPGTSDEALRAQAIVSRSYARAQGLRHAGATACDLAHCQVLGRPDRDHLSAARRATAATAGQVLRLTSGEVALTPFHAACGGHTADPVELFGGTDRTGAAAVADPGCSARWSAEVPRVEFQRALSHAFQRAGHRSAPSSEDLQLVQGAGGFNVRAVDLRTGDSIPADSLTRALDARMGWGVVRSSRFSLARKGASVALRGAGLGHGVGLCQAGASRMARNGKDHARILGAFFPRATLSDEGTASGRR